MCAMNGWGQKLRARGKELGLSEAEVARRAGIEPRAYSNYVNEQREPDYDCLLRICGVIHATPNELFGIDELAELSLADVHDIAKPRNLPDSYIGLATLDIRPGMGGPAVVEDYQPETLTFFSPEMLLALRAEPADLRVLEVEGPSMSPVLENGDRVIVNISRRNPSQPAIFVLWDGFGLVCKWVERIANTEPPRIRITSENPRFKPYEATVGEGNDEAEAYIIGRVVWYARQV
jgi:phage repressor protein C with HTH and peptisase S24 domain